MVMSRKMDQTRMWWWVVTVLAVLLLVGACGGPENQGSDSQGALSSSDGTNGSAASSQSSQGGAGSVSQSETSGAQAATRATSAPEPTATQAPAPTSIPSAPSAAQGPVPSSVGAAEYPSVAARRIGDDLESALEQALGVTLNLVVVDASESEELTYGRPPDFLEISRVVITYRFNDDLPAGTDLTTKFSEILEGRGATIRHTPTLFRGRVAYALEGLQVGGVTASGNINLHLSSESVWTMMTVDLEFDRAEIVPQGKVSGFNDALEPALEQALGVDLDVDWVQDRNDDRARGVGINYHNGDLPPSEDLMGKISGALESLGANITATETPVISDGSFVIRFEGLLAGGVTAGGRVSVQPRATGGSMILVNLPITSGP